MQKEQTYPVLYPYIRIEFPGAVYHVTSRGNAGRPIFGDDRDRKRFLNILGDVVDRYNCSGA